MDVVGSALRLLAGWLSVTIGMLNLLVKADRTNGAGGIVLLGAPTLGRRPGVAGLGARPAGTAGANRRRLTAGLSVPFRRLAG